MQFAAAIHFVISPRIDTHIRVKQRRCPSFEFVHAVILTRPKDIARAPCGHDLSP
jgi:hypothetical protein